MATGLSGTGTDQPLDQATEVLDQTGRGSYWSRLTSNCNIHVHCHPFT